MATENNWLYENQDFETDEGMYTTTPMERLINATKGLTGAGQICPRCNQWGVLFFGDPDGVHFCATCKITQDFNLEEEKED